MVAASVCRVSALMSAPETESRSWPGDDLFVTPATSKVLLALDVLLNGLLAGLVVPPSDESD